MDDAVESADFEVVDECDGKSVESETKDHSDSEPKTTPGDEESREESSRWAIKVFSCKTYIH